jgi:hypothetical protein
MDISPELPFFPEDLGDMFLRNFGWHVLYYMDSYPREQCSLELTMWDLKFRRPCHMLQVKKYYLLAAVTYESGHLRCGIE